MRFITISALILLAASTGQAQATRTDSLIAELRVEAIRSRGFIRGAETQLSKVLALIDSLDVLQDPEPSADPVAPQTVSVMGYTSQADWGTQIEWSSAVADSFRVYGGADSGAGPWEKMLPGTATMYRHPESYTEVTRIFGCVVARMNDGTEAIQACDGMDLAPMPPGSWSQ